MQTLTVLIAAPRSSGVLRKREREREREGAIQLKLKTGFWGSKGQNVRFKMRGRREG